MGAGDSELGKRGSGHDLGQIPLKLPHHRRGRGGTKMKIALPKWTIITLILVTVFLPVSLAWSAPPQPQAPPLIPTPPATGYDHYTILQAPDGNPDQIVYGTPAKDMIAQYGDTNTISQYVEGAVGNDWLLQVGGNPNSDQTAIAGDGNDTIYQYGGKGDSIQYAEGGGSGNKQIIQVGGQGSNNMTIHGGIGINHIEQYGGSGNNNMYMTGGASDDVIEMYGGNRNNTMIYDLTAGNDLVTIMGGGGYNALTINKNLQNLTLQDSRGRVLFQTGVGGSTITVTNLQRITVIGDAGKPIYTYNAGIVPSAIAPLLLLGN